MRFPKFQSITRLLIRKIVWLAMLGALLVAAINAYTVFLQSEDHLFDTMTTIGAVYVPQLATSVWDIEPANVAATINGMVENNDNIGYVQLDLLSGYQFVAGQLSDVGRLPAKTFTLYEPGTTEHVIGSLKVYPNAKAFYQHLAFNLATSLLGYVLLTFLICQLVRWVLRQHLQKPLKEIAQFAQTLDAERLLTPLRLSNRENITPNEIDLVVAGFDTLQTELSRHINHLDQMVAERTTQLEAALASIQQLYITDPLTGCYNRHYLNNQLELIFASQAQQPISLIFCDIDFFKRINDTFGHKAGDEVLNRCGQILREGLRTDSDWVARFGGEEFLVVLPKTPLPEALQVAERLRLSIAALSFDFRQQAYSITASFGVAQQLDAENATQLCERADQLLYRAKHNGRNQVCSD